MNFIEAIAAQNKDVPAVMPLDFFSYLLGKSQASPTKTITGTPPSLYNSIVGDAFAPRNPYCLKIDTLLEPPMFKVTDTHFAKTWLLDPKAPKIEKPEGIQDIHQKLVEAFNI